MYKMLAIDIDDTLINDEKRITEGTKQALTAAVSQGVIVTLATGHMYASAKQMASELGLNVPLITYQGSLVKNALDETVLYERNVPLEAAEYIYRYCEDNQVHLQLYHEDILYVKEANQKAKDYAALSKIPFTVHPDFSALIKKPSTKLLMIDEPSKIDIVEEALKSAVGNIVHITKSKPHFLEVVHKEGTKGDALAFLASHFGLKLEQVIAIGDSYNDREMLEVAGLGVAVGNAVPALKEIADYITLSNNEDGVQHVVEKFILNPQA